MNWPAGFEPENSRVHGRNEIAIAAPPERVWRWIIRAAQWHEWYPDCANMTFLSGVPPDLAAGTIFRWKTFGVYTTCTVAVFDPPHEIGWTARGAVSAYHGWEIEPDANGGCRVITEECQNGIIPALASWYLRPLVIRAHATWLECLKRMAESDDPA